MDSAKAGAVGYSPNSKEASSLVGPPKQSLDGAPSRVQMITIGRAPDLPTQKRLAGNPGLHPQGPRPL